MHARFGKKKQALIKKNTVEFKWKKHQVILIAKEENKLGIKTRAH